MQKTIPHSSKYSLTTSTATAASGTTTTTTTSSSSHSSVTKLVAENAVIVVGRRGCCMCHVVKQLLLCVGVNPIVFNVDLENEESVIDELTKIGDGDGGGGQGQAEVVQLPAVFVGGKMFGGLERVMATHITGELVPILREAKALWL